MHNKIYQSKMGIGEILLTSGRIYIKRFMEIMFVFIITTLLTKSIGFFESKITNISFNSQNLYLAIQLFMKALKLLINYLAAIIIIKITQETIVGKKINYKKVIKVTGPKLFSVVWVQLLSWLIILPLSLLLIIPGIIWLIYYTFATHVVVLKDLKGREALSYSKFLVKGRWWQVLGTVIGIFLLNLIVVFLVGVVLFNFKLTIIFEIISKIILTYLSIAITVYFLNLDYEVHENNQTIHNNSEEVLSA